MDAHVYVGLGLSLASFFGRYAVSELSKYIAWAGATAGAFVMSVPLWGTAMRPPAGSLVFVVLGFICFGIAAHLYMRRSHEVATPPAELPTPPQAALDGTIKLDCSLERFEFPHDGKLLEFITSDDAARTITLQSAWMTKENYQAHPESIQTKYGMINKCRITNYNAWPVFNLKVVATVDFIEQIPTGPNHAEQRIVETKHHPVHIPEIGASSHAELYLWNLTKFIVIVRFSADIELQKLGIAKRDTAKLIPAQGMVTLWPPEVDQGVTAVQRDDDRGLKK